MTAETESFKLSGELETPDPDCILMKLGHGQANRGMSGGPVLDFSSGRVVGMLRTSRDVSSSLGAWIVPAEVIWRLLPDHVRAANERFHRDDNRWGLAAQETASSRGSGESRRAGDVRITGDVITMITNSNVGDVNISQTRPRRPPHNGRPGGR